MSNAEGVSAQFFRHPLGDFRHPLKIILPPPGRNPENAPVKTDSVVVLYYLFPHLFIISKFCPLHVTTAANVCSVSAKCWSLSGRRVGV